MNEGEDFTHSACQANDLVVPIFLIDEHLY